MCRHGIEIHSCPVLVCVFVYAICNESTQTIQSLWFFVSFAVRQARLRLLLPLSRHNLPMLVSCQSERAAVRLGHMLFVSDVRHRLHWHTPLCSLFWLTSMISFLMYMVCSNCASCPVLAPRLCLKKSRSALSMILSGCTAWQASSSAALPFYPTQPFTLQSQKLCIGWFESGQIVFWHRPDFLHYLHKALKFLSQRMSLLLNF